MFVTLVAGLCAVFLEHHNPPIIAVGYIKSDTCEYRLMLGNTEGQSTPPLEIKPHSGQKFIFASQIGPDKVFLFVNDSLFEMPKGESL